MFIGCGLRDLIPLVGSLSISVTVHVDLVPLVGSLSVLVTVPVGHTLSLKLRDYQPREQDLITHNQ